VLQVQARVRGALSGNPQTAAQLAAGLGEDAEAVFHALGHLAANDARVKASRGTTVAGDTFSVV
jgi:hypothetical protein